MERIVVSSILRYLRKLNVHRKQQHGFCSVRSTTSNLLETVRIRTLAINNRKAVGVAYIDNNRAFDFMPKAKILTNLLQSYGISGVLLGWIKNFLHCRVGGALSCVTNLKGGVVQSSVIRRLHACYVYQ